MTLNIWRFTDGKPGHDSQSMGLCAAIGKLKPAKCFDIEIEPTLKCLKNFLLNTPLVDQNLPSPDLIIGAGHKTHLPMLCARRAFGGKIIVLMKPSLPFSFFDFCIMPKHDGIKDEDNIINSVGALNPLEFNNEKALNDGLILIGGPSKHFHWDKKSVLNQIEAIATESPHINWKIADSRRTPKEISAELLNRPINNIKTVQHNETSSAMLRKLIYKSNPIWVTTDSVSMIYEALSSGATVGLIELQKKSVSRVGKGIDELISDNKLVTYSHWEKDHNFSFNLSRFNEAERCATILLEKGVLN